MQVYCGCSGYLYNDWKGVLYPVGMRKREWLNFYATTFNTVEINSTFYGLPSGENVQVRHDQVPDDFKFSVKGSRFLTHMKKLKPDEVLEEGIQRFFDRFEPLDSKITCVLWQLPRNFHIHTEKLESFCRLLAGRYTHVIEFRHASWFIPEVFDILQHWGVTCCALSSPDETLPEEITMTTDTLYLRMHGKSAWYHHNYSTRELKSWMRKILSARVSRAFIYFNNTIGGHAVHNCIHLRQLLAKEDNFHAGNLPA